MNGRGYKTVIASNSKKFGVLAQNSNVETVTFEDDVTFENNSMNKAFSDCSALKRVNNIPKNITDMSYAFVKCPKLQMTIELNSNFNVTYSDGKYSCPEVEGIFRESATEKDSYIKIDNYEAGGLLNCIIQDGMEEKILRSHIQLGTMKKACAPMDNLTYELDKNNKTITFTSAELVVYSVVFYDKYVIDGVTYNTVIKSKGQEEISFFDIEQYYNDLGRRCRRTNLKAAYICDNVKADDLDFFFEYCLRLIWVGNLPKNSVKSMCYTFSNCQSIEYYPELPDSVVSLDYAYHGNYRLKTVSGWKFPASLESMEGCFYYCFNLEKFDSPLPDDLKNMVNVFGECSSLKECYISIPSKVENISKLFVNCRNLAQLKDYKLYHEKQYDKKLIILPKSVRIADEAFRNNEECDASMFCDGNLESYNKMLLEASFEYVYYFEDRFEDIAYLKTYLYYNNVAWQKVKNGLKIQGLQLEDIDR